MRRPITLTQDWGNWNEVSLYLDRCQVDTPDSLVRATWEQVSKIRNTISKVIDFGAGDGRFAKHGQFEEYIGYEIDASRFSTTTLPLGAELKHQCAFSTRIDDADLCIGNPPFVRNQDLPINWRRTASQLLVERTGVDLSGLANAWQYFFLLGLASVSRDGLCALVIPYEWVSRPSVSTLRSYILKNKWNVEVYRLFDATFDSVLTTSSITIVDKARQESKWRYYRQQPGGDYVVLSSPSGAEDGVLKYTRRDTKNRTAPFAMRGLSPGTQKLFTLTDAERKQFDLQIDQDVVRCVTSLRHLPTSAIDLNDENFQSNYVTQGQKCWLIRTDRAPTDTLRTYFASIPKSEYDTSTCMNREIWWKYQMPRIPDLLVAMSFNQKFPKVVRNSLKVCPVGGVYGIFNLTKSQTSNFLSYADSKNLEDRIVAHSNGLRKIEVRQLNTLLLEALGDQSQVS